MASPNHKNDRFARTAAAGNRPGARPSRAKGPVPAGQGGAGRPFARHDGRPAPARAGFSRHGGAGRPAGGEYAATALFGAPSHALRNALDQGVYLALRKVRPLNRLHRAGLVEDVVALSQSLTCSRAELSRPYWTSPSLTSAYLYYFLPWNLVRLTRLLRGLCLPEPPAGGHPLLVDLGTGPLTVPLALWLACPQWRRLPLEVLALDCAGQPPRLGRELFEALARKEGLEPWKIHVVQEPLSRTAHCVHAFLSEGRVPWLVTAANVLNELPEQKRRGTDEEGAEDGGGSDNRSAQLLEGLLPILRRAPGCRFLFVEPGTRLGGTTLMRLRAAARAMGLEVLAPCTHSGRCPLLSRESADEEEALFDDGLGLDPDGEGGTPPHGQEDGVPVSRLAGRAWCHFTFDCSGAPAWLSKLSVEAGLAKSTLSLSFLLLGRGEGAMEDEDDAAGEAGETPGDAPDTSDASAAPAQGEDRKAAGAAADAVRVFSQPFAVPGLSRSCRYGCSARGLVLCAEAAGLSPGSLVSLPEGTLAAATRRDRHSGALVVLPPGAEAASARPARPPFDHAGHGASLRGRRPAGEGNPHAARGGRPAAQGPAPDRGVAGGRWQGLHRKRQEECNGRDPGREPRGDRANIRQPGEGHGAGRDRNS